MRGQGAHRAYDSAAGAVRFLEQGGREQDRRARRADGRDAKSMLVHSPLACRSALNLAFGEAQQIAIGFEDFAVDVVIVDQDAETVLHFGQHGCDRHRIEFGQFAEQAAVFGQRRRAFVAEAEDIGEQGAKGGIDFMANRHKGSCRFIQSRL